MKIDDYKLGVLYAAGAYILWGFLPLYWKMAEHVPAWEILAHRIVWSFLFMMVVVFAWRKWRAFLQECRSILTDSRKLIGITLASIIISINWVTYIWAVNNAHVVEASLGYYINPLVSILLGMLVLKEKLSYWQFIAFILAGIGVLNMTMHFGSIPWVAILLALSFALYGLLKKTVQLGAMFGLTIETLIITPVAFLYLAQTHLSGGGAFSFQSFDGLILAGSGVMTAVPLLLFASGAKRIPLSMVGFLQYFAPTIMLFIGVIMFNEPFTNVHLVTFSLIWSALVIYSLANTKLLLKLETKLRFRKRTFEK
ncbi:MAG: EamA family transporter RarD [Bacillaceae bacterium]|nr:EamA family transporter RarD [Bacillaceae bacterium]